MRLLDLGMGLGVPKHALLEVLGVEDAAVRNPIARLPVVPMIQLAEAIEKRSGNIMAGLQVAGQLSPRSFADIGYPILYAPDLATAMRLFCEIQPFYQNVLRSSFAHEEGKGARLFFELPNLDANTIAPLTEWVLAAHISIGNRVSGGVDTMREIGFSHRPRRAVNLYKQHFKCEIRFEQPQSYILWNNEDVMAAGAKQNARIIQAASAAHSQFEQWLLAGKQNLANAYLFCILQMDRRAISLERMAAAFNYSERTLRRMLMDEGASFRDIFDLARQVQFKLYQLEGQNSLSGIALKLGYSELSALSRSRKRWGMVD